MPFVDFIARSSYEIESRAHLSIARCGFCHTKRRIDKRKGVQRQVIIAFGTRTQCVYVPRTQCVCVEGGLMR